MSLFPSTLTGRILDDGVTEPPVIELQGISAGQLATVLTAYTPQTEHTAHTAAIGVNAAAIAALQGQVAALPASPDLTPYALAADLAALEGSILANASGLVAVNTSLTQGLAGKANQSALDALQVEVNGKSTPASVDLKLANHPTTAAMNSSITSANNSALATVAATYALKSVVDQLALDVAACETAPPCQLLLRQPDKWVTDKKRQLGSSATFFACIFLSASIDGYVRYARRALHLAPIHPPAAFRECRRPSAHCLWSAVERSQSTASCYLNLDELGALCWRYAESVTGLCAPSPRSLLSSSHRDRAGRASTSTGVTGCCRLHVARQVEGAPASLNVSFDICMASATYAPTLGLAESVRLTSGRGLSQSCAVWCANRPLCPRR